MADLTTLFTDLVFAQLRLVDAVETRLRAEAKMETSSFLPLLAVSELEGPRVQDVAHQLGISVGGASKAVDRLERAGWVRRRQHTSDRRSSTITVTAAGRRQLTRASAVVESAMTDAVTLAPSRVGGLGTTLAQLRRDLAR